MNPFQRRNGELHAEDLPLSRIAQEFGTPTYVYSRTALEQAWLAFERALAGREHLICYAVKANSNLAVLNVFSRLGSGFDIVSGGELARVLAAGGDPGKVVFSGVGKTAAEMRAALDAGILCFNVESAQELERLDAVAGEAGKRAPVSIRVNPDVDPKTHPYISTGLRQNKFGVPYSEARGLYRRAAALPNLEVKGVDCHIGSQLTEIPPFVEALEKILELADGLERDGIVVSHLDLGGGLGIRYQDEEPPAVADYARALFQALGSRPQKILVEPGRALVGNAGLLLARVEYLKHGDEKNFAVLDAAMNDLMRPALYDAFHEILAVREDSAPDGVFDVVGPVCETGDFLGHGRRLAVAPGDLVAVLSAGAYGMSMSSNYNTRPRAAEVLVDGAHAHLARRRESVAELFSLEQRLP
ncbi:MAG TPA: diaminopimelate decarboxylase [Burkholderiales bacterium]